MRTPRLHVAAVLGDHAALKSIVEDEDAPGHCDEREPLLGRRPLHFAVEFAHPHAVRNPAAPGASGEAIGGTSDSENRMASIIGGSPCNE